MVWGDKTVGSANPTGQIVQRGSVTWRLALGRSVVPLWSREEALGGCTECAGQDLQGLTPIARLTIGVI
jgi:hypothetical protein